MKLFIASLVAPQNLSGIVNALNAATDYKQNKIIINWIIIKIS